MTFNLRVRTAAEGLQRIRVTLDGKTIARSKRPAFNVKIETARLRRGRHVIQVIATSAGGRTTRTAAFKRRPRGPATVRGLIGQASRDASSTSHFEGSGSSAGSTR